MTMSSNVVPMMMRQNLIDRGLYNQGALSTPGFINAGVMMGGGKKGLKYCTTFKNNKEGKLNKFGQVTKHCSSYDTKLKCSGPSVIKPGGTKKRCSSYQVIDGGVVVGGIPVGGVSMANRKRKYKKRKISEWQLEVSRIKNENPGMTLIQASQYASAIRKGLL